MVTWLVRAFIVGLALIVLLPHRLWAQAAAPVIREVTFAGAENASPDVRNRLATLAAPLSGQPYTDERAQALVTAVRDLGWFQQVTTHPEPVADGVRLVVTVVMNPIVQRIDFIGNTVFSAETLRSIIATRPGQVLNQQQALQDAQAIQQQYARKGYTLTEVTDVNVTADGVLQFTILEPRIAEIRIEGNSKTHESVIRRGLMVTPGQLFNADNIRDSLLYLQRLGIFEEVTATPEPGPRPGTVTLRVNVREMRTGNIGLGGTYNTLGGFSAYLNLDENNIFGTGQRVGLFLQIGAQTIYRVSYFNPWIDRHRTNVGFNLYSEDLLHQAAFEGSNLEYSDHRKGGNVTVGRPLSATTQMSLTLRADSVKSLPHDNVLPPILLEDYAVRSLAASLVRDTRADVFYPVDSSYRSVVIEKSGLFGSTDFSKLTLDGRRYWTVRKGKTAPPPTSTSTPPPKATPPWVVAGRVLVGVSLREPPLLDQYLVGGTDTMRGFQEERYPGERMLLVNNELRIPISSAFHLVAFVDIGDAWGGRFAAVFGDPTFHLHFGYGAGIRVVTPIGPIRLDLGINNQGGSQFHFGIGQMF